MFDAGKTKMIVLPYGGKNYDDMLSCFHLIPERYGQTDRFAISISRVSMLMKIGPEYSTKLHPDSRLYFLKVLKRAGLSADDLRYFCITPVNTLTSIQHGE